MCRSLSRFRRCCCCATVHARNCRIRRPAPRYPGRSARREADAATGSLGILERIRQCSTAAPGGVDGLAAASWLWSTAVRDRYCRSSSLPPSHILSSYFCSWFSSCSSFFPSRPAHSSPRLRVLVVSVTVSGPCWCGSAFCLCRRALCCDALLLCCDGCAGHSLGGALATLLAVDLGHLVADNRQVLMAYSGPVGRLSTKPKVMIGKRASVPAPALQPETSRPQRRPPPTRMGTVSLMYAAVQVHHYTVPCACSPSSLSSFSYSLPTTAVGLDACVALSSQTLPTATAARAVPAVPSGRGPQTATTFTSDALAAV
jgi:hypothetical protein